MQLGSCESCAAMGCATTNRSASLVTAANYNPTLEDQFDPGTKPDAVYRRRCFRGLLLVFAVVVVIFVAASIALLFTQKPVDFNGLYGSGASPSGGGNSTRSGKHYLPSRRPPDYNRTRPTLQDILSSDLGSPRRKYENFWLSDDTLIMRDLLGNYVKVSTRRARNPMPKPEPYLSLEQLDPEEKGTKTEMAFSPDGRFVVFQKVVEAGFRHSGSFLYTVARVDRGKVGRRYAIGPKATGNEPLQLLEWNRSPGAVDFVFVYENNIYYQADPEHPEFVMPVTFGGELFQSYGVADWLYEEEILSESKALWWSRTGRYVAFALFDDRNVTKVQVPYYGSEQPYPSYKEVSYPKAGTPNQPQVFLWIWDKQLNSSQLILPPEELFDGNAANSYYLYWAQWIQLDRAGGAKSEYLVAIWANRIQNRVVLTTCQYQEKCVTRYTQEFSMAGMQMWANPSDFQVKFFSKTGFFVVLPHEHPDGNVYNHVAHVELLKEAKNSPISGYHGGAYDVDEIVGYDRERDELFFSSQGGTVGEKHIFRVPTAAGADGIAPQCITCLMEGCKRADPSFAPGGTQFVLFCTAPYKHAVAYLKKTKNILESYLLRDDNTLVGRRSGIDPPEIRIEVVKMSSGIDAHVRLLVPPRFNPRYSYPVVLHMYAGPNTAAVSQDTPWAPLTYYAISKQYVVVSIDGRGSANRGWKVRSPMYKHLGGPEVDDQVEVLRILLKRYPFLDSERVATFGWSYGGFASAHIGGRDAGATVKCNVAVAPVTDFRLYDSAYTERYMLLPAENPAGYEATSLLNASLIASFKTVKLLLAHGLSDDNVHFQNSALFARALQENNVHFTQLVYPNEAHSIGGSLTHLFSEVDRFLHHECFELA